MPHVFLVRGCAAGCAAVAARYLAREDNAVHRRILFAAIAAGLLFSREAR